jgi:predicted SAM-dependent methyltransferase
MKFLNLGCGNFYHKDWVNIDFKSNDKFVIEYNLLNGIPLEDSSVDVVYHSHVLEHFTKKDGANFLQECNRVLKPNGVMRIAVPDLEIIVREYLRNLELASEGNHLDRLNYDWIKLELIDQLTRHKSGGEMLDFIKKDEILNEDYIKIRLGQEFINLRKDVLKQKDESVKILKIKSSLKKSLTKSIRKLKNKIRSTFSKKLSHDQIRFQKVGQFRLGGEVHQWMYDYFSLSILLQELGFIDIKKVDASTSDILDWQNYNFDIKDGETRKPDSLFIEARKK